MPTPSVSLTSSKKQKKSLTSIAVFSYLSGSYVICYPITVIGSIVLCTKYLFLFIALSEYRYKIYISNTWYINRHCAYGADD